jgi:hypothetical protein
VNNENVAVAYVSSRVEGELVAGLLQSAGIDAKVYSDDAGGEIASLQLEGTQVFVPAADEAKAREILAERS